MNNKYCLYLLYIGSNTEINWFGKNLKSKKYLREKTAGQARLSCNSWGCLLQFARDKNT